jgi:hypothetical protein
MFNVATIIAMTSLRPIQHLEGSDFKVRAGPILPSFTSNTTLDTRQGPYSAGRSVNLYISGKHIYRMLVSDMADDVKIWYKSKRVWLQIVVALIAILTVIQQLPLNEQTLGIVVLILAILGIVLQFLSGSKIVLSLPNITIPPEIQADTEKILDDLEKEAGTAPPEPPSPPADPPAPPGVG